MFINVMTSSCNIMVVKSLVLNTLTNGIRKKYNMPRNNKCDLYYSHSMPACTMRIPTTINHLVFVYVSTCNLILVMTQS